MVSSKEIRKLLKIREIRNLTDKQAQKTEFFKRLTKRSYRRVKGYIDYKQIATDFAGHLMCLETGFELRGFDDAAWNAMSHSAWMAYENPIFPVFAITQELAQAFLQTDLPPHVCGLNRSFSNALFLFPQVIRNPDNYLCEWAFVSHFQKGEKLENLPKSILGNFSPTALKECDRIILQPFEVNKLRWVSQLGQVATIYSSIINLPEDSDKPVKGDMVFGGNLELWGENTDAVTEQEFTSAVDKLLLQTLLYLQLKPNSISATPPSSHKSGIGFRAKSDPHLQREPIWIGKDYKSKVIGPHHPQNGHASPQMHWRRGHWKRVAIGEGRCERKWTWIEPTLVNAD